MNLRQKLQQELQDAMRAQDQQRVNVLRMLIASLEQAQEEKGKETFEALDPERQDMPPDRHQAVSKQELWDIVQSELQRRREAVEGFRAGGQTQRADSEETEIAILEEYLKKL